MGAAMKKNEQVVAPVVAAAKPAAPVLTVVEPVRAPRWHVVMTKPQAERVAKQHLENQGFEVYLPWAMSEETDRFGHPKLSVRPLFARYLFVRFDPTFDRWRCIFSTIGVDKMLMAGERPAYFPDRDLDVIRLREENGFIKLGAEAEACRFERGQAVRVVGAKADIDAVFLEPVDRNRAAILVTLLGRESRQTVTLLSLR